MVASQILHLEWSLTGNYSYNEKHEKEVKWRFVTGFIYPYVKGFASPVFITDYFNHWEDSYKKVVSFLNDKNLIVIDKSGNLVDGSLPDFLRK